MQSNEATFSSLSVFFLKANVSTLGFRPSWVFGLDSVCEAGIPQACVHSGPVFISNVLVLCESPRFPETLAAYPSGVVLGGGRYLGGRHLHSQHRLHTLRGLWVLLWGRGPSLLEWTRWCHEEVEACAVLRGSSRVSHPCRVGPVPGVTRRCSHVEVLMASKHIDA